MRILPLLAPFAAALCVALAPPARAADYLVRTWADSTATGTDLSDNPAPDQHELTGTTPGLSTSSFSGAALTKLWDGGSAAWSGTGNAQAMVDLEGIHLYAGGSAEVVDAQPFFPHNARGDGIADGEFTDTFTFLAPGVPAGTFLRVRAELVVDTLLTASASDPFYSLADDVFGSSEWIVTIRVRRNGITALDTFFRSPDCYHRLSVSPTAICPPDTDLRQTLVLQLPVGGQIELYVTGRAQASGLVSITHEGNASAGGSSDLGNTIYWGGVLDVQTQEEVPVTDFSMISETTGIDYRYAQAAPEPGGAALALSAIAALGARSALRRARTPRGAAPA